MHTVNNVIHPLLYNILLAYVILKCIMNVYTPTKVYPNIGYQVTQSNQYYQAFISNLSYTRNNLRYSNLYFRKHSTTSETIRGRIRYHAYKENLTPSNVKYTYNNQTNILELRHKLNNSKKIDWNSKAMHISELNFNKCKLSYESYLNIPNPPPSPSLPPHHPHPITRLLHQIPY